MTQNTNMTTISSLPINIVEEILAKTAIQYLFDLDQEYHLDLKVEDIRFSKSNIEKTICSDIDDDVSFSSYLEVLNFITSLPNIHDGFFYNNNNAKLIHIHPNFKGELFIDSTDLLAFLLDFGATFASNLNSPNSLNL